MKMKKLAAIALSVSIILSTGFTVYAEPEGITQNTADYYQNTDSAPADSDSADLDPADSDSADLDSKTSESPDLSVISTPYPSSESPDSSVLNTPNPSSEPPAPVLSITDPAGDEKNFQITISNVDPASATYMAAVWSADKGQDDIKWNTMTGNQDGTATVTIPVSDYRSPGMYYVHVYKNDGSMQYITNGTFQVSPVNAAQVTVQDQDQSKGTCTVLISDVSCPSGVTRLQVPVWSKSDQSDIYWYQATQLNDSTWTAEISMSHHSYNSGTYHIHAYGTSGNGFTNFIGNTKTLFETPEPQFETVVGNGSVSLSASGLITSASILEVKVAVWSAEKGQDDLKWIDMKWNSTDKTATTVIRPEDFKHSGLFYAHVYGRTVSNQMIFLGSTTFQVDLSFDEISPGTIRDERYVPVSLTGLQSPYAFSRVQMAVWSNVNGQDDIKWYDLSQNASSAYTGTVDIKNHRNAGEYQVHLYGITSGGKYIYLGRTVFSITATAAAVVTTSGEDQVDSHGISSGGFMVQVQVTEASSSLASVLVPVWSSSDQSDIHWYSAKKQADGSWTVTVNISNHKNHTGIFRIHAYAVLNNGITTFMGSTNTEFTPASYITVSSSSGKRTVKYIIGKSLTNLRAAVWSAANGQDDLVWVDLKKTNGEWTVTINGNDFETEGIYYVHFYTGNSTFLGNTSFSFDSSEVAAKWLWPVPSSKRITSYFGNRTSPTAGASSYHQGLDIGASTGSQIVAVANGTVTDKGYDSVRGYYVFVTLSNGIVTLSQHMNQSAPVSVGQKVSRGQVIGYVGSTGVATGPHLHFSVIVNGSYVNPLPYLQS